MHSCLSMCVMASAASLLTPHMLTGAYTSLLAASTVWDPTVREGDRQDWTKTDNQRHKGAELTGQTKLAQRSDQDRWERDQHRRVEAQTSKPLMWTHMHTRGKNVKTKKENDGCHALSPQCPLGED